MRRRPRARRAAREVLDDPVVDDGHPAGAAQVRVGVDVVGRAVGGPAGVADAGRGRRQRGLLDRLLEVGELAGPLVGASDAVVRERDAGGVVAAVLQAAQALDDDVLGLLVTDVAHDSAHGRESMARARPPPSAGPRPLQQCRPCPTPPVGRRPRGVAVRRARPRRWAALARRTRARSRPTRSAGCAASATPWTCTRSSRSTCRCPGCSACTSPAAGRLHREQEDFLHQAAAAAHAVRHRPGRLGRRRQVDDRPRAPADARPLARAPERRAGHHRRLPAAQRRARAPRPPAPQGLPGVLRPQGAAPLRRRHQVRHGRGRRADLLPPRLRRRARRAGRGEAAPTS